MQKYYHHHYLYVVVVVVSCSNGSFSTVGPSDNFSLDILTSWAIRPILISSSTIVFRISPVRVYIMQWTAWMPDFVVSLFIIAILRKTCFLYHMHLKPFTIWSLSFFSLMCMLMCVVNRHLFSSSLISTCPHDFLISNLKFVFCECCQTEIFSTVKSKAGICSATNAMWTIKFFYHVLWFCLPGMHRARKRKIKRFT